MKFVVALAIVGVLLVEGASASGQEVDGGRTEPIGRERLEAQGAQDRHAFDIPPQPLAGALNAFGRQSGLQVTIDTALTPGVQSQAVTGTMTSAEALNRLLAGTGIAGRFTGGRTVVLTKAGAGIAPGAMQLDPVQVQGYSVPAQAMIDNLPPPYAGGQVATGGQLGILGERGVMDTPFNQTSYTSQLIQNQQAQSLGDVLTNNPSVRTTGTATSGFQEFSIRGFTVNGQDVLFAGMPNITPTYISMMTEGLERIEVLNGPAAFLIGAAPLGSVGGSINVMPKRATAQPLTQFTPTYSSNAQFGGHIDFGRRFGDNDEFGVRINAVYRNGNTPIDNQTVESRLFTLGFDFRGDQVRASFDFGYQYQNWQAIRRFLQIVPGVAVPGPPVNKTNYSFPWEFDTNEFFYGALRGEVDIAENLTAFASIGGNQHRSQDARANQAISSSLGTLRPGSAILEGNLLSSMSVEAGVRASFYTGPVHHEMVLAHSRALQEFRRARFPGGFPYGASSIYNPQYSSAPSPAFIPSPDGAPKIAQYDLAGTTIGDTLSVWQKRVQFTTGLRLQQINAWNFSAVTGAVTSSYNEVATTPMFGLIVKPLENVTLYGNYVQGLQQGPVAPAGTINAGQIFAPSITQQWETGIKVDWGTLTTTFAAFQITQPSAFIDPLTNVFGVDGQQTNRGLEFNFFGEPIPGVRLLGGAALIDARLTKTQGGINQGNFAIGVPLFQLVAGGEWDLPFVKGLTALGRLVYDSSSYVDRANLQQVPDWAQVNVGLRYAFERANGKPIVIRANVDNVFNATYWNNTLAFGRLSVNAPRTFMLAATFDF